MSALSSDKPYFFTTYFYLIQMTREKKQQFEIRRRSRTPDVEKRKDSLSESDDQLFCCL